MVRVSRRVADGHYASILAGRVPRSPRGHCATGCNAPGGATFPGPLSPRGNRRWPAPGGVHRRERRVIRAARVWPRALPFQQFHVLFDPLSKVLFIFRSLYLCAIGLRPVFSLRRNLPPALSSIPKLLDSSKEPHKEVWRPTVRGSHPLRRPVPGDSEGAAPGASSADYNSGPEAGFQIWAVAASLAVTRAIPVGFFSSAY